MYKLPPEFDKIIQLLINTDTDSVIDNLAQNILAVSHFTENIPVGDAKFQLMGITLLAVDDAKTTDRPSSANRIYKAVFDRAKELINGETRVPHIPK